MSEKEILEFRCYYLQGWERGTFRSSHRRCSIKKGVLKNFAKFTRKHLCQRLFFDKVADLACNFIKKTPTQVFFCEYCEILKNTFFTEHLRETAYEHLKLMNPELLCKWYLNFMLICLILQLSLLVWAKNIVFLCFMDLNVSWIWRWWWLNNGIWLKKVNGAFLQKLFLKLRHSSRKLSKILAHFFKWSSVWVLQSQSCIRPATWLIDVLFLRQFSEL